MPYYSLIIIFRELAYSNEYGSNLEERKYGLGNTSIRKRSVVEYRGMKIEGSCEKVF